MPGIPSPARIDRRVYFLFGVIVLVTLTVNIEIIRTFPAWFDEAFMANISFNFATGNGRTLDLIPGYRDGEINIYGPVYFYLQALLINIFGLHDIVFRAPNVISAYVSIALFALVLRNNRVGHSFCLIFVVLAVVDISISRNMLSGRMDMLAVMFVMTALALTNSRRFKSGSEGAAEWSLVGVSSALAYLTTPRAVFLLPVVLIVGGCLLYQEARTGSLRQSAFKLVSALAAFLIPVLLWVIYVGGFAAYIKMFTSSNDVMAHFGTAFFRNFYDNIAIAIMLVLAIKEFSLFRRSPLIVGLFTNYLAFSLFVVGGDIYQGMIMPFVLAAIATLSGRTVMSSLYKYALFVIIALPGAALLSLRVADLHLNPECRDYKSVTTTLDTVVADAENVVAPFKYYYLLERSDRNLTTLEYRSVDRIQILGKADVVVQRQENGGELFSMDFDQVAEIQCQHVHVKFLPNSFYRRTIFNEKVFRRQSPGD